MKDDNTLLFLLLAGAGLYLYAQRGKTAAPQQTANPQPTDGLTLGKIAGGWLDSILGGAMKTKAVNAVASNPVQTYVSAASPNAASLGAVYNQNQLTGVANLVSAGSSALSSLVNIAGNLFGKSTTKPASTPAASAALPSVQVAGGIPGSAVAGGIDTPVSDGISWPSASDWSSYA